MDYVICDRVACSHCAHIYSFQDDWQVKNGKILEELTNKETSAMAPKKARHISADVILVDLSSYVFYRNFAIHKWKAAAKIESLDEETFRDKFRKLFVENLLMYARKLNVCTRNITLVRDCPRQSIWRMKIYPEYKQTRTRDIANFDPYVFQITYDELVPSLQKEYGMKICSVEEAEADDVIAVLAKKYSLTQTVYILSCDNDFIQLESSSIKVLDFQLKSLVKGIYEKLFDVYLTWKIIYGDESDNIPSIDKKIGRITAETLARNPDALAAKLQNPQVKSNYERNRLLIDMSQIPAQIVEKVLKYEWME
jgi:5'-3' exonuclease